VLVKATAVAIMMRTRRAQLSKQEEIDDQKERTRPDKASIDALKSIHKKLNDYNIKVESIIEQCAEIDMKGERSIHPDDLIDIFKSVLPSNAISRREFHYLIAKLGGTRGQNVHYYLLAELFDGLNRKIQKDIEIEEKWHENRLVDEFAEFDGSKGSIGEWLHRHACPAEIESFKTFIACLERYERETGLRIEAEQGGFDVPLGPDLRANIKFYTR
jgi:hypothetical protein